MSALLGFLLWGLLFYPAWSPRLRRMRKLLNAQEVSRNSAYDQRVYELMFVDSPWEQDSVWPEVFEEEA